MVQIIVLWFGTIPNERYVKMSLIIKNKDDIHKALVPKWSEGFTYASKNPWQSVKRNNSVLDRLCQKKYYFQKAKKLFKKLLTN